jgi:hypothetical protein
MGKIIYSVEFPSSLSRDQKILGKITIINSFPVRNVTFACEVWTKWANFYYMAGVALDPQQTHVFDFPADFTYRDPTDAPDPTMPNQDAILYIKVWAFLPGVTYDESATVTIKLVAPGEVVVGGYPIPIWAIALAIIGAGGAILYATRKKWLRR